MTQSTLSAPWTAPLPLPLIAALAVVAPVIAWLAAGDDLLVGFVLASCGTVTLVMLASAVTPGRAWNALAPGAARGPVLVAYAVVVAAALAAIATGADAARVGVTAVPFVHLAPELVDAVARRGR